MWTITNREGRQKGGGVGVGGWTVYDKYGVPKTTANAGLFNVLDFGATGDDIASDGAIIQAAIDAAGEGDQIYLPPGLTYYLGGSALTLKAGQTLYGVGATIRQDSGKRCINAADNCRIIGITFDGGDDASANTTSFFIDIADKDGVRIEGCKFDAMGNRPINIHAGNGIWIERCEFTDLRQESGQCAIGIFSNDGNTATSSDIHIIHCRFVNADIDSDGVAAVIIQGATDLQVRDVFIDGCYFEYMGRDAGATGPRGDIDIYNDVIGLHITNCTSVNSAHSFVKGNDGQDIQITNNTVRNPAQNGIIWQRRYGNTRNARITIKGNQIYSPAVRGMYILGADDGDTGDYIQHLVIANNTVQDPVYAGIRVRYWMDISVTGNIVYGGASENGIELINTTNSADKLAAVVGNVVDMQGNNRKGIYMTPRSTTRGTTVIGNSVYNTGTAAGIDVAAAVSPIINGNALNSTAGIVVSAATRAIVNDCSEITGAGATPTASNYEEGEIVVNTTDNTAWVKDRGGTMQQIK